MLRIPVADEDPVHMTIVRGPSVRPRLARVDAFTVVFGGLLLSVVVTVLLLGAYSQRSARDYLDWKPTRSPEAEAQNELDDVEQMIAAQNELKRRRGAPEISEEEIERRVEEDRDEMRRWRES